MMRDLLIQLRYESILYFNSHGQVPINYEKISPLFLEKKDAIEWAVTQNYWDIRLIEEEVL